MLKKKLNMYMVYRILKIIIILQASVCVYLLGYRNGYDIGKKFYK